MSNTLPEELQHYVGLSYVFEDNSVINIIEIKRRDEFQYWVKFTTKTGPGIPRQGSMVWEEFKELYGHLFPNT